MLTKILKFGSIGILSIIGLLFSYPVSANIITTQIIHSSVTTGGSYPRMPYEYIGTGLTGGVPSSVQVYDDSSSVSTSETKVVDSYSTGSTYGCPGGSGGCSGVFLIACPPGLSGCTATSSTSQIAQYYIITGGHDSSTPKRWVYGWLGVLATTTNTGFGSGRGSVLTTYTFGTSSVMHIDTATTTATTTFSSVPSDYLWFVVPWSNLSGTPKWDGSANLSDYPSGFPSATCLNTSGTNLCTPVKQIYFTLFDNVGAVTGTGVYGSGSDIGQSLSHFTLAYPLLNTVVSTTTTVGASGYLDQSDYQQDSNGTSMVHLRMTFTSLTRRECIATNNNFFSDIAGCSGISDTSPEQPSIFFDTPALDLLAGTFTATTSDTFLYPGLYQAHYTMEVETTPWWHFGFFKTYDVINSTDDQFTVGSLTQPNIDAGFTASSTQSGTIITYTPPPPARPGAFTGLFASTTASMGVACNPFNSNFSMGDCTLDVVYDPSTFNSDMQILENTPPWGYGFRFWNILTSTTSQSIPVLSLVVPPGIPGTGATFKLDLNHSLDYILNATTSTFTNVSASSTETFYQITSVYWNYIVYVCLGLYMLARLLGTNLIGGFFGGVDDGGQGFGRSWRRGGRHSLIHKYPRDVRNIKVAKDDVIIH